MSCSGTCFRLCGLLLATAIVTVVGCMEKHPDPVDTPPPVVAVAAPVQRDVTDYQIFTARTEAVDSVDVKARVTGYLMEIKFKDGDEVAKDKVLFEIDNRPYKAALDKAKADVETAEAALVKNEAFYKIGLDVRKENPAAMSEQEIDRRKGARDESVGSLKQAKASQETAQLNFDWCTVKAPISGRINRHFVGIGNLVSQDVTVLTNIVSLKPMWAYLDVDQNTALLYQELVKEGKVEAARTLGKPVKMWLGTQDGRAIDGVIDFVSNQLDPNTGSIRLRAMFPNTDEKLVAGLFARIRVPIRAKPLALLVNDLAIGTDQGQKFVFVVNDKNEVEYRPVEVGQVHDVTVKPGVIVKLREVSGSLKPTDRLIVNGLQRVRPGVTVRPEPVDMRTLLPESGSK